ncbi:MAG TPA: TetR/AcrR family transcriptional regulator [Myxococcales bacterium]|nr:TetR/AcrR family transcriptional regulator [Myxococcales bacterium]HIK83799.1 TetR/AcrR family transcriptional regulator [Myxococcales bacterium]
MSSEESDSQPNSTSGSSSESTRQTSPVLENRTVRTPSAPSSREKILEVGESLFAARGYAGVGMREIAASVGLSKSSLFHHFPTKLVFYGEVLDRALERLERALCEETEHPGAPAEQLDHWIASIVGTLAESAPVARLLLRSMVDEDPFPPIEFEPEGRESMPFERRLEAVIDRFRRLLEHGIEEGVFRPVSVGDAIQTTIGAIVFHFASGDLGEALIGEPIFSGSAVERRRQEVSNFIRRGLLA